MPHFTLESCTRHRYLMNANVEETSPAAKSVCLSHCGNKLADKNKCVQPYIRKGPAIPAMYFHRVQKMVDACEIRRYAQTNSLHEILLGEAYTNHDAKYVRGTRVKGSSSLSRRTLMRPSSTNPRKSSAEKKRRCPQHRRCRTPSPRAW